MNSSRASRRRIAGNAPTAAFLTTPLGAGGLAVIEIIGNGAFALARSVFRPGHGRSACLTDGAVCVGHVVDAACKSRPRVLDEVMVRFVPARESFTGMQTVEINCHGGMMPARTIMNLLLRRGAKNGNASAIPRLAWRNGKINAIQMESLELLPDARTKLAAEILLAQFNGALARELARVEALVSAAAKGRAEAAVKALEGLQALLRSFRLGRALVRPPLVVIAGRPNVGKSTLFNTLAGTDRAITDRAAGTTRDPVEETVAFSGVPIRMVDTAGRRRAAEGIERLAIKEAERQTRRADIVMLVFDASRPLSEADRLLIKKLDGCGIVVLNKCDLRSSKALERFAFTNKAGGAVRISAKSGEGIEMLKSRVLSYLGAVPGKNGASPVMFTPRQRACVSEAMRLIRTGRGGKDMAAIKSAFHRCVKGTR